MKKILLAFIALLVLGGGYFIAQEDSVSPRDKVDGLRLPEDATVYLETKSRISDVNWFHCTVEKVIRCEQGLDWFREYLKEHNSYEQLRGVNVCPFDILTDMGIYSLDRVEQPERGRIREDGAEKYILIEYWVFGEKGKSRWRLVD